MRQPAPSERQAWLEAIQLFDEAHDEVLRHLEELELQTKQGEDSNGKG